ncbi:insulin/egf-receptor l domain protein [Anaeramoeba flamelloides]|uniref:Insulin/egf-receptor l domain protein n=1 Tax=Anaeramoeba flamelloides TaxID=1746091 RepID=A0AAV7ZID9_9EUKA|nr:insulin/egf-receptor l domain protein [Anaeramoeba flamelloides]
MKAGGDWVDLRHRILMPEFDSLGEKFHKIEDEKKNKQEKDGENKKEQEQEQEQEQEEKEIKKENKKVKGQEKENNLETENKLETKNIIKKIDIHKDGCYKVDQNSLLHWTDLFGESFVISFLFHDQCQCIYDLIEKILLQRTLLLPALTIGNLEKMKSSLENCQFIDHTTIVHQILGTGRYIPFFFFFFF